MLRRVVFSILLLYTATPVFAVTRSWTGAASANWSDANNWSPSGIPAAGDSLVFPNGPAITTINNDLPAGTSFGPISFGASYTLNGNALTLTGDVSFTAPGIFLIWNAPITMGASIHLGSVPNADYAGAIDVNGQTLTIDAYNSTVHALNGSGAIVITGSNNSILGSGNFSGTITGSFNFNGSLPNASVSGDDLSGVGTLGPVTITANGFVVNGLMPGAPSHGIGTLQTGPLNLVGALSVDLVPGGTSDQVKVIGTVTLSGPLSVSVPSGSPMPGQTFTIIDNDGTDAVSGTFSGLAEGATFTVGSSTFRVSYRGGDGNDVVLSVVSSSKTWTGAVSGNWSDARNWSPQAIPAGNEPLVFPNGPAITTMNNDLPAGTSIGPMTFGTSYTLNGNALTLTGDLSFTNPPGAFLTWNAPITLGASIHLGGGITSDYAGAIDVNGHTLTVDSSTTTLHALNGSGAIVMATWYTSVVGNGNFSGTITGGFNLNGSLPNASVTSDSLSGVGALGSVLITQIGIAANGLMPGAPGHGTGMLQTGPLNLAAPFSVDLVPGGTSDQVKVTGSVTLSGQLFVSVSGPATPGQTFTIIDNDGTDAVSGTFSGLPEGATLTGGATTFRISYRGGDGNDVVLTAVSVLKSWTGAVSGNWSDARNWSPQAIPGANEALVFPNGPAITTMNNDLPAGASFGPMTFGTSYTLNGNALTLTGDAVFANAPGAFLTWNAPLTLGASIRLGTYGTAQYAGGIDVNGHTLTIDNSTATMYALNGSGAIAITNSNVSIVANGNFNGTITGSLHLNASLPNASVSSDNLSGVGTLGAVTITANGFVANGLLPGLTEHSTGTLQTGPLTLTGPYNVDLAVPGASDQVKVTGSVKLSGPLSGVVVVSGSPTAGQTFTIIDNDGTDAVSGTFSGLPEGGIVSSGPWLFGVSYHGGDGNDVVLTRLGATSLSLAQDSSTSRYGQPVTFTATITAENGVPTGFVTFHTATTTTVVPLQNGVATFTTAALGVGTQPVYATYASVIPWSPATSPTVSHVVLPADTTTSVSGGATIVYGNPSLFTVSVNAAAPGAGVPTGTVALSVDGAVAATVALTNGSASFNVPLLPAGTHMVTAAYGGDPNFNASTSAAVSEIVARAPTAVVGTTTSPSYAGMRIAVTVTVTSAPGTPTGSVAVTLRGRTIAQQDLSTGAATTALGELPVGDNDLEVAYSGDANFLPSSTAVRQIVLPPAIVASDVTTAGDAPHAISIPLTLSAPLSVPASVDYATADGTAVAGKAYQAASGTVSFPAGLTTATLTIKVIGNASADAQQFTINFTNAVNASIVAPAVTITITGAAASTRFDYAPGLSIDLYAPPTGDARPPLLLYIPGMTAYDAAGSLAALGQTGRGYAVARVAYRPSTAAHFPAQLNDLLTAVQWIRANAAALNIDPNRIGAWGFGTGAHLAALLGTSPDAHLLAVVEIAGATDLPHLNGDALACSTTDHNAADSPESSLLGCSIAQCPEAATAASPLSGVTSTSAAMLIVHGEDDCVISPAQAVKLYDALRDASVYTLLRLLPGVGHDDASGVAALADDIDAFLEVHLMHSGARLRPSHH